MDSKKSLPLNNCGKIIVAQDQTLDSQIDVLLERGKKNNVPVELLDMQQIKAIFPGARSTTGRGIWSPNTSVTNPKIVMKELESDLKSKGIEIIYDSFFDNIDTRSKSLRTNKSQLISYGHLFNCAGSYSVEIAKTVGIGMEYNVIPFKGIYWELKEIVLLKSLLIYILYRMHAFLRYTFHAKCWSSTKDIYRTNCYLSTRKRKL